MGPLTLDQVKATQSELGPERLTRLREECRERSLHTWDYTDAPDRAQYCTRCFYLPRVDGLDN